MTQREMPAAVRFGNNTIQWQFQGGTAGHRNAWREMAMQLRKPSDVLKRSSCQVIRTDDDGESAET